MTASNPTTDHLCLKFTAHLRDGRKLSELSVEAYTHDVVSFLGFLRTTKSISTLHGMGTIRPRDIRGWLAARREAGLEAASSRARALSSLKAFFRYLQRDYRIENAPVMAMSGPKKGERLPRPTSEQDTSDLIDMAGSLSDEPWIQARDVAVLTLLYGAGLRIYEALSLKGDMLPPPELLRILGKRNKVRIVPLIPATRESLLAYSRLCPYPFGPETPLFYGARGGPLSPRMVQRLMQTLRASLGLADSATPHALRHAFASHLLAHGGDLRSIQALMGHASPSTTQVYLGLEDARLTFAHRSAHPRA